MKCKQPRRITKNLDPNKFPDGLLVRCGVCMQCRLDQREHWVLRLYHEYESWKDSMFVTLTYSDDHLPINHYPGGNGESTLLKDDVQLFLKRLRKRTNKKLKYFICGEYGEELGRPHYHGIIYGLDYYKDEDRQSVKDCWKKCDWEMLMDKKSFGSVNVQSIRYVVSYLEKSIHGSWEEYAYDCIQKPFHIMSKGIGKIYAKKNGDNLHDKGYVLLQGFKKPIPRYYSNISGRDREYLKDFAEEKEKLMVKSLTGNYLTRDELYRLGTIDEVRSTEDRVRQSNLQNELNLKARDSLRKRKKKRDI